MFTIGTTAKVETQLGLRYIDCKVGLKTEDKTIPESGSEINPCGWKISIIIVKGVDR